MKNIILFIAATLILQSCSSDNTVENPDTTPPDGNSLALVSFNPTSGFCRDEVTIIGQNFSADINGNIVSINGTTAEVLEASTTQLKITVPLAATTGKIKVQVGTAVIESGQNFEVRVGAAPIINRLSAGGGVAGDMLTIEGENFSNNLEDVSVKFAGVPAIIMEHSVTRLQVQVPNSVTGAISVLIKGQEVETVRDFIYFNINISQVLEDFITNNPNVPSVAMTVVKDGEVFYQYGAGYYDHEGTKIANENTLYLGSSISKLMIAIAIMQQVELGNLDLDADIGDYLSFDVRNENFPNKTITARMLMQHGASLANPNPGEATATLFLRRNASTAVSLYPLIENVITPGSSIYNPAIWLSIEPGNLNKNSNYGMTLLGYLVEELSGQHFNDYTKEHILEPLGMSASSFFYPDLNPDNIAALYQGANNVTPLNPFALWFYPAGMMYTSGEDWSKFMGAILNGGNYNGVQIIQSSSVDAMLNVMTPVNNQLAYNSNIGLIWREAPINAGWIGHTGGGGLVTHITEMNREKNIGYIVFTNEGGADAQVGPVGTLNSIVHQWLLELQ